LAEESAPLWDADFLGMNPELNAEEIKMKTWSRLLIGIALVAALLTFTAYTEPASAQGEIKV